MKHKSHSYFPSERSISSPLPTTANKSLNGTMLKCANPQTTIDLDPIWVWGLFKGFLRLNFWFWVGLGWVYWGCTEKHS